MNRRHASIASVIQWLICAASIHSYAHSLRYNVKMFSTHEKTMMINHSEPYEQKRPQIVVP